MTSAHSTKNTSIRTRKIRGEDSLFSSISIAEREEGPAGIADVIRCWKPISGTNMAQRAREKSWLPPVWAGKKELRRETRLETGAYFPNLRRLRRLTGFGMVILHLEALAAI